MLFFFSILFYLGFIVFEIYVFWFNQTSSKTSFFYIYIYICIGRGTGTNNQKKISPSAHARFKYNMSQTDARVTPFLYMSDG